ncbi:MAG: hypothetical protein FWE70_08320 [Oscillospiraceae bacterium]|nr:hypothetical protein [Oscillospiraceae bacterium]
MTKVTVEPGICGLTTEVTAEFADGLEVSINVETACPHVAAMMAELGETFDPYGLCLAKPGEGPLYGYAAKHFPSHCGCPSIAGITKAVEAECGLALPRDAHIRFGPR